jgi:aminopeptidase YwaD
MATAPDPLTKSIVAHLHHLCARIGPRPGGSLANRAASEYIAGIFSDCGLSVERQEFPCTAWEATETTLDAGNLHLEALANTYSPPCDLALPAVSVGTLAELAATDLAGRIAILHGELTARPLAPKGWFLRDDRDRRITELLEARAPAALLTVQARPGNPERLIEDDEFHIPSATVPAQSGLHLRRAAPPFVRLRIASRRASGQTWNIIGRRPGTGAGRVVLCAHYDTKVATPGALDNGGGVATLLALAGHLRGVDPALGLECIAFGNEEYLPEGTGVYLGAHEGELGDIIALLNFDGVGHALNIDTVAMMAHSAAFQSLVEAIARDYPGIAWTEPWPESNHAAFAWRGVPCLAFTSPATRHLAHSPGDTLDWVNPARLGTLTRFAARLVAALAPRDPRWTREGAG